MKITKSRLQEIIREEIQKINEDQKLTDYWADITQRVQGDFVKVGGEKYFSDWDYNSGALSWGDQNSDIIIFMTPAYDGVKYIPVEDGNTGKVLGKIPLKTTGNEKKDTKWYLDTVKKSLPKFIKKIK